VRGEGGERLGRRESVEGERERRTLIYTSEPTHIHRSTPSFNSGGLRVDGKGTKGMGISVTPVIICII
jgi:hypothetical protein